MGNAGKAMNPGDKNHQKLHTPPQKRKKPQQRDDNKKTHIEKKIKKLKKKQKKPKKPHGKQRFVQGETSGVVWFFLGRRKKEEKKKTKKKSRKKNSKIEQTHSAEECMVLRG